MRAFEIFLQESRVTAEDWQRLVNRITEYDGNFTIEITFEANSVEFHLYSQKDLSLLATKLEGFVLKPIEREQTTIGKNSVHKRIGFRLSSKNILELKELEELKRQRIIERVHINYRKILTKNIHSVTVFLRDVSGNNFYSSYFDLNNPLHYFELDFKNNMKVKKKSVPLYLKIDDVAKLFTHNEEEAFLEVFGFPHFSNSTYFPLNRFEFGKHSLIVGQTGVGKSKFIELFVKNIALGLYELLAIVQPEVVIVGGGNSALDSAILLDKYCTKITIVNITPTLTGERHMIEQVQKNPKIDFLNSSRIVEILGDKFVNAVRVDVNGSQKIIKTQGVFIEIGSVPCVSFDNLTKKNKYNEIIVSEDEIYSNKTSVEGIFAAGDVTSIPEKQAIVSAGEGAKAILSIFKYLGTKK